MRARFAWLSVVLVGALALVAMLALATRPAHSQAGSRADLALGSNSPVYTGTPAVFTATVTGTLPYTYVWDFGDGSDVYTGVASADPFSVAHTYEAPGVYSVTVDLTDSVPAWFSAEARFEVLARRFYLPLAVRNYDPYLPPPPIITNGGFETGDFAGWVQGGRLPRSLVTTLYTGTVLAGNYSALLGDPGYGSGGTGVVPTGGAWITQTFTVPEGYSGILSLSYRLQGWDGEDKDRFRACLTDVDTLYQFCYYDTLPAGVGVFKDTGWTTATIPMYPAWRTVEVSLQHWNEIDGYWNTWTYVDEVKVILSK